MSEQEILALAGIIKGASEIAWSIAIARVYAYAVQCALWSVIFFCLSVAGWLSAPRFYRISNDCSYQDESKFVAYVLCLIFSVVFTIAFAGFLTAGTARLLAPDFFAVQFLMGLV